jgi:O-antigen ligase
MITIILGATWLIGANRMLHIVLALVALALTSVFLALTLSKTSMNLTVLGLLIILFFALSEKWGTRFILFAGAIGLLLATSLIVWLATLDFDTEKAMQIVIGDTSFSGRDELWAFTRRHAERRYWLGHGYGAYWDVGLANDPLVRAEAGSWLSSVKVGIINQAHHGYLELWLHVGRPAAAIAALLVIKSALIGAYRTLAGDASVQSRAAFGGFTVMLVLHMLHNLTEASLFMRGSLFCSTVFLGMFLLSRASERDLGGRVPAKQ